MAKLSTEIRVIFPWWWRLYIAALWLIGNTIGGIDSDKAAKFLVKHSRFKYK